MTGNPFLSELIAGSVGGVAGITLVYPLDTAKMRLQTHSQYRGLSDCLRTMVREEGWGSLYRGLLSPQVGFGVTFSLSFAANGQATRWVREWHNDPKRELTTGEMVLAGTWAGIVQSPARQVFERIKSVMQVQHGAGGKPPYSWSGECVVQLVRKEGLYWGLFRGLDATIAREVPQFAVYYPAYELCVRAFRGARPSSSQGEAALPPHLLMMAGGIAGTVQWLPPFYCADVLKSRMQSAAPGVYSSVWDCAVKSYRAEGMQVFFRGLGVALVRAFPLHAIIFLGYETTMATLHRDLTPALPLEA